MEILEPSRQTRHHVNAPMRKHAGGEPVCPAHGGAGYMRKNLKTPLTHSPPCSQVGDMNAAALPTGERYPAVATTKDEDAVFARATERLFNIGAVPVSHFLQEPAIVVAPQNVLPVVSQSAPSSRPATGPEGINTGAVARLHQACQQAFGSTEALNYEFEVDDVSNGSSSYSFIPKSIIQHRYSQTLQTHNHLTQRRFTHIYISNRVPAEI